MPNPAESSTVATTDKNLLSSVGWMAGSNLVAQVFAYGSLILLARWLDPASFGTVSIATSMVFIGVLFVDQGTWGAVIVERQLSRQDLARAFWRCMTVAIVLAGAMVATSSTVVHHFAEGGQPAAVAAIALCLPLHGIAVVPTALLQRALQFRRLAGVNGIANVGSAVIAVLLASDGAGVWALVTRQLVLFGMIAVISTVLCLPALSSHAPRGVNAGSVRTGIRSEWWFFLFMIAFSVNGSLDKLIVGLFGSAAVVGLYSMACTIAMAPLTQFAAQVGQVLFAAAASDPEASAKRTVESTRLMSWLMLPLLPLGALIAPVAVTGALGEKWAPVIPVFQILLIVGVGNSIISCIADPIAGTGHMPFRARLMVAQSLASLVVLLLVVPAGGIRGAALAELLVFAPVAAIYFTSGARRAGTSTHALWIAMRPAVIAVALQSVVSMVVLLSMIGFGVMRSVAECSAAAAGLITIMPLLLRATAEMRRR